MSMGVGLAVACAVLGLVGTGGRRARAPVRTAASDAVVRAMAARDLSAILLVAAAQLRAGVPPAQAWGRALADPAAGPVPTVAQLAPGGPRRRGRGDRGAIGRAQRAQAVVAAARLSDQLGAPLASVLERVAVGLAADEECEGERAAALAGPRATAQVLAWLPLLGLLLGGALGADPVAVVLGGGLGTVAAVAGLALLVLGRWWTAALLARASNGAGSP